MGGTARPRVAKGALQPQEDEEKNDDGLGAQRADRERQQERGRGVAALRGAEAVHAAAVIGIPERHLMEVDDSAARALLVLNDVLERVVRALAPLDHYD